MKRTDPIERQADNAALLGQGLQNGLSDPPDRIADKLESAGLIKPFSRLYQAYIAFVN